MQFDHPATRVLLNFVVLTLGACASSPRVGPRSPDSTETPPARQIIAQEFEPKDLENIKVAFFDADSTLRVSISGSDSPNGPKDVLVLPFIGPKLKRLADEGYLIAIISNQDDIASGAVTIKTADAALRYTIELLREQGGVVHYYDFSESSLPTDPYRKPNPGMGMRLEGVLITTFGLTARIDRSKSIMVGDSAYQKPGPRFAGDLKPNGKMGTHSSNSDRLFALNFHIPFQEPADLFGWRALGVDIFENKSQLDQFIHTFIEPSYPDRTLRSKQ